MLDRKIMFVSHTAELGGAEIKLLTLIKKLSFPHHVVLFKDGDLKEALVEQGCDVNIIGVNAASRHIRRKSSLFDVVLTLPHWFTLLKKLRNACSAGEILVPFSQKSFVLCAILGLIRKKQRLVWSLNDILSTEHFNPNLIKLVVNLANRTCDRVIVNSKAARLAFVHSGGNPSLVRIMYPGVESAPFDAVGDEAVAALRKAHSDGGKVVSIVGRLAHWKGQHIFIRALASIPEVKG